MVTKKITKKMTFAEAMQISQMAGLVFLKYGLHCVGCAMSREESIEDGAKAHGLTDKQITEMVSEANKLLKDKKK